MPITFSSSKTNSPLLVNFSPSLYASNITPVSTGGDSIQVINGNRIHSFTTVGTTTFTINTPVTAQILIVGGGGGGGAPGDRTGGGGGAGGLVYYSAVNIPTGSYTITVGGGGSASGNSAPGTNGSPGGNSSVGGLGLTTAKGGAGGEATGTATTGGSAGGRYHNANSATSTYTVGQGNAGGTGYDGGGLGPWCGGGGGGAGGPGNQGSTSIGGVGGDGLQYSISGTPTYYAGGGGGGISSPNLTNPIAQGTGGNGGGGGGATIISTGNGIQNTSSAGTNGTGGGGGGGARNGIPSLNPSAGGSGIVIISFSNVITNYYTTTPNNFILPAGLSVSIWVSAAIRLTDPGLGTGTNLGTRVSINATGTVAVSVAPNYSSTGAAIVWRYTNGIWGSPVTLPNPGLGSPLTGAVSINVDGTVIAAGLTGANSSVGAVVVWTYSGGTWGSAVTLSSPSLTGKLPNLGSSVSINSNGTVVTSGAPGGGGSGTVVVWTYSGGTWGSPVILPDPGFTPNSYLGTSVSINNTGTIITSGAYNTNTGTVVVWTYSGGVWGSPVTLPDPGLGAGATNAQVGISVSINSDGTIITSGAQAYNTYTGAVVVWKYSGGVWNSPVTLPDPGLGQGGYLGSANSVSINNDGTVITAGAIGVNTFTGAVVVWTYSGGVWGSPKKLQDPGLGTLADVGYSVSMNSTGTVIISGVPYTSNNTGAVVVWNK